jgi:hypothetical protein
MPQPYPGQQWKHGWKPLTSAAEASKAKKGPPPPKVARAAADAGEILRRMKRQDASRRSVTHVVDAPKREAPTSKPAAKPAAKTGSVGTSATGKPLKIGDRVQVVSGLGKGRTATIVGNEHGRVQVETPDGIRRVNDAADLAHVGDSPSRQADDAIRKAAGRPTPTRGDAPRQETRKPPTVERAADDIRDVYADIAPTTPTGRVSLLDLRKRLPEDLPREMVDQALTKLSLQRNVHVTPQANQKILTKADRAAAVRIADQDKHFIEIEQIEAPTQRRPATQTPSGTSRQADDAIRRAAGRPAPTAPAAERPRREAPAQNTPRQSPPAPEPRTQAPQGGRAADKPAPKPAATPTASGQSGKGGPVDGSPSDKPIARNAWGTGSAAGNEIAYHDDGAIGTAIKDMGADARMNVDGQPLANVLGKLATDGVAGRKSTQEMVDAIKNVRDRLPAGSAARRELDRAIGRMDAPTTAPPKIPDGALPPLAKLAQDLHKIPTVRNDPDTELKPLLDLLDRFSQGRTGGRRVLNEVRALANKRHESLEGKAEIDRLVTRALQELERMQQADRTALHPPTRR